MCWCVTVYISMHGKKEAAISINPNGTSAIPKIRKSIMFFRLPRNASATNLFSKYTRLKSESDQHRNLFVSLHFLRSFCYTLQIQNACAVQTQCKNYVKCMCKCDPVDLSNFRPDSNLPFVGKINKRMVAMHASNSWMRWSIETLFNPASRLAIAQKLPW